MSIDESVQSATIVEFDSMKNYNRWSQHPNTLRLKNWGFKNSIANTTFQFVKSPTNASLPEAPSSRLVEIKPHLSSPVLPSSDQKAETTSSTPSAYLKVSV